MSESYFSRCAVGWHLTGLIVLFLALVTGGLGAAETASPPAGMAQQQYDELVKAVGQSVIQTLTDKGLVAKPAAAPAAASDTADDTVLAERVAAILAEIPTVLGSYPDILTDMGQLWGRLDRSGSGGRGAWGFLGLLVLVVAVALLAEAGVRRLAQARQDTLARDFGANGGLWRLAALALLDFAAVLALVVIVHAALGTLFNRAGAQTQLAGLVLNGLVTWRLLMLVFRLFLRPTLAAARIAPVGDASAHRLTQLFGAAVLIMIIAMTWVALLSQPGAVAAAMLTNSVLVLVVFVIVVLRGRNDISMWLIGLIDETGRAKGFKAGLARRWHWIALPVLVVLAIARAYDALSDAFSMPVGAVVTLYVILGLLLAETLSSFIVGRHEAAIRAGTRAESGRFMPFLVRAVRATLWVGAAWVLVRTWAVDVLMLVDAQAWGEFSRAWTTAVVTALVAYFAWEAVHFATERHGSRVARPGAAGPESDAGQPLSASRLETLAPILRILLGVVIFATAGLTILASLGVSITPFIAGASVFGLAISFGSQTLVHDIVSGLFYLADDAFRVGEYIDCGKAKGTVEGFTLRSIRLRHQNGQINTIPFGQLGQIANFSRDWSTLKFNLRFVRDTDIDKLRKVTKKIGQVMAEDPTFKDDFLEPLKLQGVADIADNATVMRFKMTVRPVRPSYIQREAIKRLIAAFKEAGIEFASATVAVQAIGGQGMDTAAAAAAASAATAKAS
jgi:moderate conductance mechanosensitive channel